MLHREKGTVQDNGQNFVQNLLLESIMPAIKDTNQQQTT
jgi:hypothetical protein